MRLPEEVGIAPATALATFPAKANMCAAAAADSERAETACSASAQSQSKGSPLYHSAYASRARDATAPSTHPPCADQRRDKMHPGANFFILSTKSKRGSKSNVLSRREASASASTSPGTGGTYRWWSRSSCACVSSCFGGSTNTLPS